MHRGQRRQTQKSLPNDPDFESFGRLFYFLLFPIAKEPQQPFTHTKTPPQALGRLRRRGAADGNRTRKEFPPRDFKSLASANFATAAEKRAAPVKSPLCHLREKGLRAKAQGNQTRAIESAAAPSIYIMIIQYFRAKSQLFLRKYGRRTSALDQPGNFPPQLLEEPFLYRAERGGMPIHQNVAVARAVAAGLLHQFVLHKPVEGNWA